MDDFLISSDFNSPTDTIKAASDKGRAFLGQMFGLGCVSINLPKSKSGDFIIFAKRKGLAIAGGW